MIPPLGAQQPPTDEEQAAAALAAIEQQIQGLGQEPQQPMGPPGFLERLFTSGAGEPSFTPMGFGSGLLQGLAGGLASRGQKVAQKRQQVEALIEQQRQAKGQQQLKDLEARRAAALKELNDVRAEGRATARNTQLVDDALVAKYPKLAPLKGERIEKSAIASAALRPDVPYVIMGANGQPIIVPTQNSFGFRPPPPAPKPPSATQQAAQAYFTRMDLAVKHATAVDQKGQAGLEDRIAALKPIDQFALYAPTATQSPDIRRYSQAIKEFATAILRKESGAAISDAEYKTIAATYFVQPGDDDATIAQKRQSRQQALESIRLQGVTPTSDENAPEQPTAAQPVDYSQFWRP